MELVITGRKHFLDRYEGFSNALSIHFDGIQVLPTGKVLNLHPMSISARLAHSTYFERFFGPFMSYDANHPRGYVLRSRQTEKKIRSLRLKPDFVIHLFSLFGPFWDEFNIPYAMYLDHTMALGRENWPLWAPFRSERDYERWIACEKRSYDRSQLIFTMGHNCKNSLVHDYNIPAEKIHVVGSSGNFRSFSTAQKAFGTQQILFQGSEFERKGGDLLLQAFRFIRASIPSATLVIIGSTLTIEEPGVKSLGYISSAREVENLFLTSDLVIAPARCDPFTAFVIEAMNYGVPCIVTRRSGISEIISNRENGIIIDSLDPAEIAAEAVKLLTHPADLERISSEGKKIIRTNLNWEVIADKVARQIKEISNCS
jgi:glycogen synthase